MLYSELLNEVQRGLVSDAIELLHRQQFRGCLYYLPMGSGKTRVGLISGLNIYPTKPILVVCSKTLLGNWVDEIQKLFGTTLQYEVLHRDYLGKRLDSWRPHQNTRVILTTPEIVAKSYKDNRLEARYVQEDTDGWVKRYTYHLPTNGPLLRDHLDLGGGKITGTSVIHSTQWDGLYIDECQNYTNITTNTCRALACISRKHSWLLSGTPLQEPTCERLLGFFQLLNYPYPSSLPELRGWLKSGEYPGIKSFAIECEAPKLDVKLEEQHHIYDMSKSETIIFLWFRQIIVNWIEYYNHMKNILPPGSTELLKIRGHLLSLLTYIRIGLVAPKIAVSMLMEKIEKEAFLSGLFEVLDDLKPHIANCDCQSSRLDRLDEILSLHFNDSCIVFSNFVQTLSYARDYVIRRHDPTNGSRNFYILESSLSSVKRSELLKMFREDKNGVLFMTYTTGSCGLNLQTANVVINLEPAWNVGTEQQAVGRAYRMGQTQDVYQHYLVSNTQFELSVLLKQVGKTKLLDKMLNGGDNFIQTSNKLGNLTYIEMAELIENEPIEKLMNSGERHIPKIEEESVVSELTPKKLNTTTEITIATTFNPPILTPILNTPILNTPILNTPILDTHILDTPSE